MFLLAQELHRSKYTSKGGQRGNTAGCQKMVTKAVETGAQQVRRKMDGELLEIEMMD